MAKQTTTTPTSKNKKTLIPDTNIETTSPKPLSESLKRIGDMAKDWEEKPLTTTRAAVLPIPRTTTTVNWSKWAFFTGLLIVVMMAAQTATFVYQTFLFGKTIEQMNGNINALTEKTSVLQEKVETLTNLQTPGRIE